MGRLSKTTFWCRICACPVSHESAPSAPMTQRQWVIYDALKPEKRAEFGASVIRAHDEATATKETR